ncbi:MAG TPA: four helix bundle protein, partial [Polyangiaceae bacterium]
RGTIEEIERRDPDLGRQMRRASTSVVLNIAEGTGSRGRNKALRYQTALGSMRETLACIEIGVTLGYVRQPEQGLLGRIDHVLASLFKLAV